MMDTKTELTSVLNDLKLMKALIDLQMHRVETLIRVNGDDPAKPAIEVVTKPEPAKVEVVEEPLVINAEWQKVLDLLNNGSAHVFVTGEAGTGKSTLLNYFADNYNGGLAIVAPTGVAALRVRGETIHRFFGFGAHAQEKDDVKELSDSRKQKYRALDVLIIDEISMVRADLMDAIDQFLRKNGRHKDKPFGGVRLVMFGDLYQLSPISKEKDEKKWLKDRYGDECPYFFHAECWRENPLKICELTTIFRQKDETFTKALNAIRSGIITPEHLTLINSRVKPNFRPPTDDLWITLTTTNYSADQANQRMINSIQEQAATFEAFISGEFDLKNAPTDQTLVLKPGAAVMFIRNNKKGWVNGTLGKVKSVKPLRVEVHGIEHEVETETWENITYEFDEHTKKLTRLVKGEFNQIPLKLAAAITIHKGQGLTFDQCIVDLAGGAFAPGQAYVGLSRCRTLDGMILRKELREDDLITSTEVQHFMRGEPIARSIPSPAQVTLF